MKQLIKIIKSPKTGNPVVNAKDLFNFFAFKTKMHYQTWIKLKLFKINAIEDKDYVCIYYDSNGNRVAYHNYFDINKTIFILTLDCAKEVAISRQTPKGIEAYRYFRMIEKEWGVNTVSVDNTIPVLNNESIPIVTDNPPVIPIVTNNPTINPIVTNETKPINSPPDDAITLEAEHVKEFEYDGTIITFLTGNDITVNATEMAKKFGKSPFHWLRNQQTSNFITAYSKLRNRNLHDLVIVKNASPENGGGTWMHEDIALEFARWLNPMFAIWCNDRIKELMLNGYTSIHPVTSTIVQNIDEYMTISKIAKSLNEVNGLKKANRITSNMINDILVNEKYFRPNHKPYQKWINQGFFVYVSINPNYSNKSLKVTTSKGFPVIQELLSDRRLIPNTSLPVLSVNNVQTNNVQVNNLNVQPDTNVQVAKFDNVQLAELDQRFNSFDILFINYDNKINLYDNKISEYHNKLNLMDNKQNLIAECTKLMMNYIQYSKSGKNIPGESQMFVEKLKELNHELNKAIDF